MGNTSIWEQHGDIEPEYGKAHNFLLIELKARVDDLEKIRRVIELMAAKRAETLKQTDTYFKSRRGRLKLREIDGSGEVALIYYEREDVAKPKKSDVFILTFRRSMAAQIKRMLKKALGIKVIVSKVREVYYYQGVRIHLDTVKRIGTFVEFEKSVSRESIKSARTDLKELLKKLGIDEKSLERASYSDLAFQRV